MSKKGQHVVSSGGKWSVRRGGEPSGRVEPSRLKRKRSMMLEIRRDGKAVNYTSTVVMEGYVNAVLSAVTLILGRSSRCLTVNSNGLFL
jgi:hypothetical protein